MWHNAREPRCVDTVSGPQKKFPTPKPVAGYRKGTVPGYASVEQNGNHIRAVRSVLTEYPVPTSGSGPTGIAAAPDGALWFAEESSGKIGRITGAGVITEFSTPTSGPQGCSGPRMARFR